MLRALSYRNYRLFFGGQVVSLVGTWITTTATNWLVYRLTGSALPARRRRLRGAVPGLSCSARSPASVVDRWDRHRLLVVTQTISMLQSFALAALRLVGADHARVDRRAERRAGARQRVRHAGASGVPAHDDREQGGSRQRDRAEFVDGESRAARRSVDRRRRDRGDERRLVLPHRRRQLRRRDRGAAPA